MNKRTAVMALMGGAISALALNVGVLQAQTPSIRHFKWEMAFDPERAGPPSNEELREYGQMLDRSGYFESRVIGTNDRQVLDTKHDSTSGVTVYECLGTIWPERHAHRNAPEDLTTEKHGGGRITAKVKIEDNPADPAECREHVIWHVLPGTTDTTDIRLTVGQHFVYVYDFWIGNGGATARVKIIRDDDSHTATVVETEIRVCVHPEYGYQHALARWIHRPCDAALWWSCVRFGCCSVGD